MKGSWHVGGMSDAFKLTRVDEEDDEKKANKKSGTPWTGYYEQNGQH